MPKPKIDEMIDKLMDEFESMFDYYLGFDIHDESVDMSDTPDSDSEESDADDGAGPAMLITSPASQRSGASSTSPSSQSSILGSRAKCHTVAGEPGSAAGSSKAAAKAPARGSSKASSALGKRKIQDSGRPEDEDDDGNGERRKRQKDSEEESKGLSHHLAAERCQDIPEKRIIDGITGDQERQIRSRRAKEGVNTEEDKWRDVYFILFPNDREAPSPYCVSNQATALSPGSVMFQNFERYSRREFPRLVRAELEVAALREEALMQERLRSVMVDAARRAAETLWEEFRNNNVQANGSNGEASQHVESSLPGPDVDFLAAPPLQPAAIPDARTVMAEEGRRYSTQGNGPSTDTSGSDSAYGTLLSGSNLAYSAARFPVASRGGAQEQSSLERVSLRTNAVVGGPSLSEHSDHSLDGTSIVPTQFESGPVGPHPHQQQQHQPYVWSSWDPGFRPEDWNLFNEQNMTTGAYLDDPSLQAPLPGDPRMGGDPTDSNG
ncbi:hypothetical protein SLS58_003525 [Diplodia intermedia]|uniref:Uncharacterized protein n=1 Tax=Diplodia intermedia TaxID=856260 RepID=A0ABR3TWF9_9PEZI